MRIVAWSLVDCCVAFGHQELGRGGEIPRSRPTTEAQPDHHTDSGTASSSARTLPPIGTVPLAEEKQLIAFHRTTEEV